MREAPIGVHGPGNVVAGAVDGGTAKVRSFVALPLPPSLQTELLDAAKSISADLSTVKWSRKVENLHVTLKFLGDVAVDHLAKLAAALLEEGVLGRTFQATVRGFGAFPDARQATTIWVGVEAEDGRLQELADMMERVGERLGLWRMDRSKPRRPFRPHITVGRCKQGVDARRALEPLRSRGFGTFPVAALDVYESRLGREGSTYVLRGRAPLLQ